jgi:hypothetical protein
LVIELNMKHYLKNDVLNCEIDLIENDFKIMKIVF